MATIAQRELFSWKEIEKLGDLERLRLVLDYLPDEELMEVLEGERGRKGRNDYPVRGVWNSILAGIIYGHESIESLRREMKRNSRLLWLCGFELTKDSEVVPPAWVYTRFLKKLMRHQELLDKLFDTLVDGLQKELPDLGRILALDGKALRSAARGPTQGKKGDGRRDSDADRGVKTYLVQEENGSVWKKTKSWFGYKLHLIVDANYELPLGYSLTKASRNEIPESKKVLKRLKGRHPELMARSEYLTADRGLDDTELNRMLWDEWGIKPLIDIRNLWRDGEQTRRIEHTENVVYDYRGTVYCYDMRLGYRRPMAYGGFEADRGTLKYRCPARHYGCNCSWKSQCRIRQAVRINLAQDRRVFTPVARSSYKWKDIYKKRTAVERVNSRLDCCYGFERHFIRGLAKMRVRMSLAMIVMLSLALGRIREKQSPYMRSLMRSAA
jgi:hypothetical protein